ncbi:MAG: protein kinase [Clostridiales bacterium]|nr:protein kinase [Clostridiales bacterium]
MTDPSFFKELHSYEDSDQSLVINEITGDIGVLKRLSHYSEEVYDELSSLNSSHFPKILCHGRFEGFYDGGYIVIEEHINGTTLEDYLEDKKPSLKERMRIYNEIADALNEIHSLPKPVIHRDIKASNIMVTNRGGIVIIDFDAAKIANPAESRDTTLIGTQGYAAPEQYGFAPSDERTDIYAFGKLIEKMFPDSPKMLRIAKNATRIDPEKRFRNIRAMKNESVDLSHSIFPPPGFRNKKPVRAVIATLVYGYVVFDCFRIGLMNMPLLIKMALLLLYLLTFLAELDLVFDWVHIMSHLPYVSHHRKDIRVTAKIIWAMLTPVATFIAVFIFSIFIGMILMAAGVDTDPLING